MSFPPRGVMEIERWCYLVVLLCTSQVVPAAQVSAQTDVATLGEIKKLFTAPGSVKVSPTINIECVIEHCIKQSAGCLLDANCRSAISCAQKCMDKWNEDKTPEKFHVQNCTNDCSFTYADAAYEDFMGCVSGYQCIAFPPINNTCRAVHPLKQLSFKDVPGDWWVLKGHHPVYDCYPCQRFELTPINETFWNYSALFQVYLINGSLKLWSLNVPIPSSPPGQKISFVYNYVGLYHHETWWLIDKAEDGSYALMYYCGHTLQWYYEGALVLGHNRALSNAAYANIASAFQQAVGLDTSKFCTPSTSTSCPD